MMQRNESAQTAWRQIVVTDLGSDMGATERL